MKLHIAILIVIAVTPCAVSAADMADVFTPTEPIHLLKQPREAFRFHIAPHTAVVPALTAEDIFQLAGKGGVVTAEQ